MVCDELMKCTHGPGLVRKVCAEFFRKLYVLLPFIMNPYHMLCGFISLIVQTPQYKLIYHIKTTKTTQNVRLPQLMYYYHSISTFTSFIVLLPHKMYLYLNYCYITTL